MRKVKRWLSLCFATVTSWRIGRAVALVALLAIGTGLYISMSLGEAGSPSASGENTLASRSPVYSIPEDPEVAEAPYDALSKNFSGIAAPGNELFIVSTYGTV